MTKNILILEDDVQLAMQWSRALSLCNLKPFLTHGAVEAVQVFYANEIDPCVVDFMVHENGEPSPNGGLSFLGKLGATDRKKTKILGVSGMTRGFPSIDAEAYLLTFGAEEFLAKPFTDAELIEKVNRLLSS